MKKKLFLALILSFVLALTLVMVASASTTTTSKVTLNDGTEVNLFDSEGNALIWYLDGNGSLQSIRANDTRVSYTIPDNSNTLTGVEIVLDGETVANSSIVVFNVINVDAVANATILSGLFNSCTTLQYAYLHLNTEDIRDQCFMACSNLKYVNLEALTKLKYIGTSGSAESNNRVFQKCSSLFKGEILDLSNTALEKIYSKENFQGVAFVGIKLPFTLQDVGEGAFNGTKLTSIAWPQNSTSMGEQVLGWCSQLETVYLPSGFESFRYTAFRNSTKLNTVFFCGTRDEFITILNNIQINPWESGGNVYQLVGASYAPCGLWPVIGATTQDEAKALHESLNAILGNSEAEDVGNLISYAEYQKLTEEEKTAKKYVVYNYSSCETYEDGAHTWGVTNACVSTCDICKVQQVNHSAEAATTVTVTYTSFLNAGAKTTSCTNEGCTYSVTETMLALFTCSGYSAAENGSNGVAIGFKVNTNAIEAYTGTTGKTLKYGVFAVLEKKLNGGDIFDKNGTAADGVISAELTAYEFTSFALKIIGFTTDEHKEASIAMGAYVETTKDGVTEYSYMQSGEPANGGKYCFSSYNGIIAELEAKG